MTDPLEALIQAGVLRTALFPPTSRYHGIETATIERPDGEQIIYLRRRFIPPQDKMVLLQEHLVKEGDRLDRLAAQYLGNPELFWRICDANSALSPDELEDIGRPLRIALPEGMPGMPNG